MNMWKTTAAALLMASGAAADSWDCVMTVECLDQEACAATEYEFTLGTLQGGSAPFVMSSIAGERPMTEVAALDAPDQRAFVSMVQNLSVGLFSLYPDMSAHYTEHSQDYSVRYAGTCEERS